MIIYCNHITKKEHVICIMIILFICMAQIHYAFTRGPDLPNFMMMFYPVMILSNLMLFNYCYQLNKTVYSLEFKENTFIITTYWGKRKYFSNELNFSFSKLTILQAKIWDMTRSFHDEKEIITIRDGRRLYYICNKNDSDRKLRKFLKDNNYLT